MRIGIAGLGTVGGSVYKILTTKADEIEKRAGKKCFVSRVITRTTTTYEKLNIPGELIAEDFEDLIINSDIVVETIGGTGAALDLVKHALELNRVVVTPNKMLISEHGNELIGDSKKKSLFFEGAVGGGIPIISLLEDYLVFHGVKKIRGILNGTTNYILCQMQEGMDFKEALKLAQNLGYAEADPTNDVEGYDAAYKISVLSGVKTGYFPGISMVNTEGITKVTYEQIKDSMKNEKKKKLVGSIDFESKEAKVELLDLEKSDPLWGVDGVENAIEVSTDQAGSFFLKGEGAGGIPTATAVISDILRASRYSEKPDGSVVVMKFGGTSVSSPEKIKSIAGKIAQRLRSGIKPVIVVSAMGNETDELEKLAREINNVPDPREMAALLSTGEQRSTALMAMALQNEGVNAISFSGSQAKILTDSSHNNARIRNMDTDLISRYISKDYVPVIAGFQGVSSKGEITTLGRGGSDLTAIALANSLGSELCELYKDVDGVYTANPSLVKNAKPIKELSWEEMIELSRQGAQVLQSRAAEFARKYGIKVLIKNAHIDSRGTLIWEGSKMESPIVRAVTSDENVVKVVLHEVPDKPGVAARILRTLSEQNVNIDMIIQSTRSGEVNTMSFIILDSDLPRLSPEVLKDRSEAKEISIEKCFAKLSLVGVNLTASSTIAATLFEILANEGVNIDMISANNSRISVIVKKEAVADSVKAIHSRLGL